MLAAALAHRAPNATPAALLACAELPLLLALYQTKPATSEPPAVLSMFALVKLQLE